MRLSLPENCAAVLHQNQRDNRQHPHDIRHQVIIQTVIGAQTAFAMGDILHRNRRMTQRHELDGRREHQSQAPRAQRVDHEQRLRGQPVGEQQRGKPAEPRASREPARHAHTSQTNHCYGHEHAFRRNAEEGVREAQIAQFHQLRLPGLRDLRAGNHIVDIAGEQLIRPACESKRLGGQHERNKQSRRRSEQHDQIRPCAAVSPAGNHRILLCRSVRIPLLLWLWCRLFAHDAAFLAGYVDYRCAVRAALLRVSLAGCEYPAYDGDMTLAHIADNPPSEGWDLHCHTVFSDGRQTPADMVREACALGLHGVAITDHDTTAGWNDAATAATEYGLHLVRGTEVTADADGVSVHMLAYQYDPHNREISGLFAKLRRARLERTKRMVELISKDYPITWDDVLAQIREGDETTVGRPHIADALVAAGAYPDRSAAFNGAVGSRSPYYIPTPSPDAADVVRAVKQAGGVSVIAHAGDPSRNAVLLSDDQIGQLIDAGLDGLEVWHRGNPPQQRRRLLDIASRHHLLITGGSDWHGQGGKPNRLGENLTDDETVRSIVERGAIPLI